MAWIEVHQTLPRHRKVYAVAKDFGMTREAVAGHLVTLWLWAVDNAPLGVLPQDSDIIDESAGCPADVLRTKYGCPADTPSFTSKLIEHGLIDETDKGWEIHDWWEYTGKLIGRRIADTERKRVEREAKRLLAEASAGRPKDVRRKSTPTVPHSTPPHPTELGESTPAPRKEGKKQEPKHKHGEYGNVLLTDEEYSRLITEFTEPFIATYIRSLDEWLGEKGKSNNHNLTIRKWIRMDREKGNGKPTNESAAAYEALMASKNKAGELPL